MKNPKRSLGQRGEDLVTDRLRRSGFVILARNWRSGTLGELDIVAQRANELVFVEVRTRRGPLATAVESALESVTPRKQARLALLAQAFLAEHNLGDDIHWRIDVAAIGYEGNTFAMEVIKHAVDW